MRALLQVVTSAKVTVQKQQIASIQRGLLVYVALTQQDSSTNTTKLLDKICNYRVFPDAQQRLNLSLIDVRGELLLVPQFTLAANTAQGLRPSLGSAAAPSVSRALFEQLVATARQIIGLSKVASGRFQSHMLVDSCNDGPLTFILQN